MTAQLKSALNISTRSHQGLTRAENQDAAYTDAHSAGFMAVADGLGGHQSGKLCAPNSPRVSSKQALQTLRPSSTRGPL